jgi:hypothetical protein
MPVPFLPQYLTAFLADMEVHPMAIRLTDLGTATVRTSAGVDPAKLAALAATAPHTLGIGVPAPAGPACASCGGTGSQPAGLACGAQAEEPCRECTGVPAPSGPVCVRVLVETPNPTNGSRGHWAKAAKLGKQQRGAVALVLAGQVPPPGPWVVTLTRVSVGTLDPDGLQAALKRVRDVCAQFLLGGTVGQYDADERIVWEYKQARGKRGAPAVDVEIRTR